MRQAAERAGLVTFALDDIDWEDEIRVFLEERASFSPDGLTGLEANLRFGGPETMEIENLRAADRLAELDLPAPQRGRRGGRAQTLRHRPEAGIRYEARVMMLQRDQTVTPASGRSGRLAREALLYL